MKQLLPLSHGRNPYRFSLRSEHLEQKILTLFYRITDPVFSSFQDEDDTAMTAGMHLIHKESVCTMEWDLRQGAASLLIKDLQWILMRVTPTALQGRLRKVRNWLALFFTTDDISMEEIHFSFPSDVHAHRMYLQKKIEMMSANSKKIIGRPVRNTIHFRAAVRFIMLRSLGKMRQLPKLLSSLGCIPHRARRMSGRILTGVVRMAGLFKKSRVLIMNKRN